jgi:hypothetical protein
MGRDAARVIADCHWIDFLGKAPESPLPGAARHWRVDKAKHTQGDGM